MGEVRIMKFNSLITFIVSLSILMAAAFFQIMVIYGEEEATYEHTINYSIDLQNIGDGEGQTPAAGDGYVWDDDTKTLTINNLHIDCSNSVNKPEAGINFPKSEKRVTVVFNGANKITGVRVPMSSGHSEARSMDIILKGGSGNLANDSIVFLNDDESLSHNTTASLGANSLIENLTVKINTYWGINVPGNLTVLNSDISAISYDSPIYCLGYFESINSTVYAKSETSSAIYTNIDPMTSSEDCFICDKPIIIRGSKITVETLPQFVGIAGANRGGAEISDSVIDSKDSGNGINVFENIDVKNSVIKQNQGIVMVSGGGNGTINIDDKSSITGIVYKVIGEKETELTAYGKTIANGIGVKEGRVFIIDENAMVTVPEGFSVEVSGGKFINNGILKGTVNKTSGIIECNNHCLTDIVDNEDGTHISKCLVCGEENISAYKITFKTANEQTEVYVSALTPKLSKNLIPEILDTENMKFECWSETKAEDARKDAKPFNFDSEITKDTDLYAVFARKFMETNKEDVINLIYNTEITETIDLFNYVKFADENIDINEQFYFEVYTENPLPEGLTLNSDGTITGKPIADVKEDGYTVKFVVTDKNPYISLSAFEPEPATKEAILTLKFNIQKAEPFVTVKAAEGLIYDKEDKVLIDYNNTSVVGGEIQYSFDNINYSSELPTGKEAREYTIWYKVVGGQNYNDKQPASVTVTIEKADSEINVLSAENLVYTGESMDLVGLASSIGCNIQYSFDGIEYFDEIPTGKEAKEYKVWYKGVVIDNNYNNKCEEPKLLNVIIAKANPVYEIPKNLTAIYGETLANVKLPNGFTWNDNTQSVGNIGMNTFIATYTPTDINNYNIIKDIPIIINVIYPDEKIFLYGDVDGSFDITVNDASCLLNKVLNSNYKLPIEDKSDEYIIYADVDGDGVLTARDVTAILQKALQSDFKFKVEK